MGSFPGPHDVWGPATAQNYRQRCFSWLLSEIKYPFEIHFLAGLLPDPGGEAYDAPQTDPKSGGEGTPLPCFLPLESRRLRRLDLGPYGIKAPRAWFPGPRCGCDGPGKIERTLLLTAYIDIYRRSIE